MLSIEQAKQMAAKLKSSLEMRGHKISYSAALETVSQQLGYITFVSGYCSRWFTVAPL